MKNQPPRIKRGILPAKDPSIVVTVDGNHIYIKGMISDRRIQKLLKMLISS